MTKKEANAITGGGLTNVSKMPCKTYNTTPLATCLSGRRLARIDGSVCASCYACKGRAFMPSVQAGRKARDHKWQDPRWVDAMVTLISGQKYFRWHSSGDVESLEHLAKIIEVCWATPQTMHWLPTHEAKMVELFALSYDEQLPDNLVIRVSADMIGEAVYTGSRKLQASSVSAGIGFKCPATYTDKHACDDHGCRACWDKSVYNVDYKAH